MPFTELNLLQHQTLDLAAVFESAAPAYCLFHEHPTIELVHHVSGRGTTRLANGQWFEYRPNDVVLYPAGMSHDQTARQIGMDLCVHLRWPGQTSGLSEGIYIPPLADQRLRAAMLSLLAFRTTMTGSARAAFCHRITAIVLELLTDPHTPPDAPRDHASQAMAYLQTHFATIDRLDEVASATGISLDHLRHLFTARYGTSMQQSLIDIRLAHAQSLLAHSPMAIKTIARASGFANERYFCSCFKRVTGKTPGGYRRAAIST